MDSQISLALAAKLRMLFEKNDKYLAFPLGAGFTHRYLDFMKDPSVSGLTLPIGDFPTEKLFPTEERRDMEKYPAM
jgi:hypothetical protein